MLSSQQLLKNGRYSIERSISTGPAGTIYLARDTQRKATVAVIERQDALSMGDLGGESLARMQHEGLVRINDDFEERSTRYSATEPLSTTTPLPTTITACEAIFRSLGPALMTLNAFRSDPGSVSGIEISPETLVTTADGKIKLLYCGTPGFSSSISHIASPFAALEAVWESLDHITQKAIYNSYDETSLAVLESSPDSRTDIYSLGAVFYKYLTGRNPISAVERAIEMLDSNADPLRSAASVNPAITAEQSGFLMRMLEVRREQRFGSIEDAMFSLPSAPQTRPIASVPMMSVVPEPEDFPLLEIPLEVPPVPVVPVVLADAPTAPPERMIAKRKAVVDTSMAFNPPFIGAEKIEESPSLASVSEPMPDRVKPVLPEPVRAFEVVEHASGGAMKFVAVGAGVVVVAVAIGWAVLGGSSPTRPDPSASLAAPVAVVDQPPAQSQAVTDQAVVESAATVGSTEDNTNREQPTKPRPQIADTRPPESRKTPKPAAKNEAKPAKKLTVEDLIN